MFGQSNRGGTEKQICHFYQRGNCKYGNKCWYIHQGGIGAGSNVFGESSLASSFTGFNNDSNALSNKQFLEFVKQVETEMNGWEKNGMWLLSSLAPLKEHPMLAGFTDTSPEELRSEAYEAQMNNNLSAYHDSLNKKLLSHKEFRQALRDRTSRAMEALRVVFFKTGTATQPSGASDQFGNQTSGFSSYFAKSPSSQPSLFGGNVTNQTPSTNFGSLSSGQSTSMFGGSGSTSNTSLFGGKSQHSAFGTAPVFGSMSSNNSTFGSAVGFKPSNEGSIFGGNQSSSVVGSNSSAIHGSSIFGGGFQNTQSTTGLFGPSQQNSTSIFGANSSPTGTTSLFGEQNKGSSTIFGATNSQSPAASNIFGKPSTQAQGATNLFGGTVQNQNSSIFGGSSSLGSSQQNQTTSAFSGFGLNSSSQMSSNIFGGSNASSNSIFGSPANFSNSSGSGIAGSVTPQSQVTTIFGQQPPPSLTGNIAPSQVSDNSVFGTISSVSQPLFGTTSQQPSANIVSQFGASATVTSAQTSTVVSDPAGKIYTPMHLLSEEDKAEFERDVFIKIPLVPPPKELCF